MITMRKTHLILLALSFLLIAPSCSISFRTAKQLDGGIFRSADGGETWTQVVNAGVTGKRQQPVRIDDVNVQYLRFDPVNPGILYVGTLGAGIFRTETSGDLWTHTGLSSGTYSAFSIDPNTPSILYAASGGTIIKSVNDGAQWSTIYLESKPNRAITDIAVQAGNTGSVLAATSTGELLLSKDFGNTWQLFSTLGIADSIAHMFYAPGSTTRLYALSAANGLFRSNDSGKTWESLSKGLAQFPGATSISSIATLPSNPDTIYVATGYGLLKSADGGFTWTPIQTLVPFGSQPIQYVAVNPENLNTLFVIVGNKLRKSTDGGMNWDAKIAIPTGRLITALALNPMNPSQLFIGTLKPKK